MIFEKDSTIVFIGDSVTDDARVRPIGEGLFGGLGNGFVSYIDAFMTVKYPDLMVRIINMGLGGNTSRDVLERWDSDVTAFNPDYVVLDIGINDVWRQFDCPQQKANHILPDEYESNLRAMAAKTKAKMIWMTPYYLEPNTKDAMRVRTDEYGAIMKRVAAELGIPCIDLQAEFAEILKHRHSSYITWDRVHPGKTGSLIIAKAFLKSVGYGPLI